MQKIMNYVFGDDVDHAGIRAINGEFNGFQEIDLPLRRREIFEIVSNSINHNNFQELDKTALIASADRFINEIQDKHRAIFDALNVLDEFEVLSGDTWKNKYSAEEVETPLGGYIWAAANCRTLHRIRYHNSVHEDETHLYRFMHDGIKAEFLFSSGRREAAIKILNQSGDAREYIAALELSTNPEISKKFGVMMDEIKAISLSITAKNECRNILAELGFSSIQSK